jgi:cobalt-zinc-cadmium efflux system outer membrane protein
LLVLATSSAWAQAALPSPATTLKQAFEAAWLRQPEARSRAARHDAATAHRQTANNWTAEPPSLEVTIKSDHLQQNQGSREDAAGLSFPLWLPGERARTGTLAEAELRADASRVRAAQLRTAASLRESYWQWQRARGEHELALARLGNAHRLGADVAKRVRAGELARADQHQADGVVASAEAALAEAASVLSSASHQLRALTGMTPESNAIAAISSGTLSEPLPDDSVEAEARQTRHPAVAELFDRAEVARGLAELASVQTRGNPELTLAMTRNRGQGSEPYQQSVTLGLRIPFGSDSRNRAKLSSAQAELIEAEGQLGLEQSRVQAGLDSARIRLDSVRAQLKAADRRAQLARESRSFFQKSYQLGETDLPTRLRIELEAVEAERQATRTRIDLAAAVSALRQSLGLLPQ